MIDNPGIGTKKEVERKIRILKSLIKADLAKKDQRALKDHKQALLEHENQLRRMN